MVNSRSVYALSAVALAFVAGAAVGQYIAFDPAPPPSFPPMARQVQIADAGKTGDRLAQGGAIMLPPLPTSGSGGLSTAASGSISMSAMGRKPDGSAAVINLDERGRVIARCE